MVERGCRFGATPALGTLCLPRKVKERSAHAVHREAVGVDAQRIVAPASRCRVSYATERYMHPLCKNTANCT